MKISNYLMVILISVIVSACATPHVKEQRDAPINNHVHAVSGTISVIFSPTVLAKLPKPPMAISLVLKANGSGDVTVHKIVDPSPVWAEMQQSGVAIDNFSLELEAGVYHIQALQIDSESLGPKMFQVPVGSPYFRVADNNVCTYVGRINFAFVRLPRGSLTQAQRAAHAMANQLHRAFELIYLPMGALLPIGFSVDTPKEAENSTAMRNSYRLYKAEIAHKCKITRIHF